METDPNGLDTSTRGAKLDHGKAPLYRGVIQYFPRALNAVAHLSQFGAEKYSWHGWSAVDDGINRYTDALARHLFDEVVEGAFDDGPGGSGELHATAVAWNALARLEKILEELSATPPRFGGVPEPTPTAADMCECSRRARLGTD